jgi:hypothetical protein
VKGLWAALAALVVVLSTFGLMKITPHGPLNDVMRHPDMTPVKRGELILGATRAGALTLTSPVGPEATREALDAYDPAPADLFAGVSSANLLKAIGTPPRWKGAPEDDAERARREAEFEAWLKGPVKEDPKRLLTDAQRNGAPGTADHFARWAESIVPMLFFGFLIPGVAFGVVTRQFKRAGDVVQMMVGAMATMAPVIVLAFFAAQFIEYFKYSGLDRMLAYAGGTMLAKASLGPSALIVAFIAVTMLVNLLIASMSAKYSMFAPIFVPMLMLVGISPELTQCAYRIGDSVTNIITPLNSYLVIILAVVQRYAPKGGMGTIISMMMPFTITFMIAWMLLVVAWMALGLPLGPGAGLWYTPGN